MMRGLLLLILPALLWSCAERSDAPVPRRRAYPRVQPPDTAYEHLAGLPLLMTVNAAQHARTERRADGSVWLTVDYPAYRAHILCTFTPVDMSTIGSVLDNRHERMRLNAGAGAHTLDEFVSDGGYHSSILRSQPSSATPVQFIAADVAHPGWVVSGSVFFEDASPSAPVDSVSPVVDIMHGEVTNMLRSLKDRRP